MLVVSSGDDALVEFPGARARHFPQLDDGMYAGHHPADDEEAIAELERLRERGADYLVAAGDRRCGGSTTTRASGATSSATQRSATIPRPP